MNLKETLDDVKDALGLQPQPTEAGAYIPSTSSLKLAAPNQTNYDHTKYDAPYTGDKKILMVCTEQQYMTMENGKRFDTGNHPVEMMVPLLHFERAGFAVDIYTPTGDAVKVEHWAMPAEDEDVKRIYAQYQSQLTSPKSLAEFVANDMTADNDDYAAIFIPGGHGAMLGLPEDANLGALLRWAHDKDLFTLAICHGPAALLAANVYPADAPNLDNHSSDNSHSDNSSSHNNAQTPRSFIYDGYKMVAFPTAMDMHMPKLGYLPGPMPWYFGNKLESLGVTLTNKLASGQTLKDRKLISGDGPLAANDFGKLAARELLKALS